VADMTGGPDLAPGRLTTPDSMELEFCGERRRVGSGGFRLGARADLNLDDPPALPDELLELRGADGLWYLRQTAGGAVVTLREASGAWGASLRVGRAVPVVFARQLLTIAADRGHYEVEVHLSNPVFLPRDGGPGSAGPLDMPYGMVWRGAGPEGTATERVDVRLTREQRLLLTVLCAPVLRDGPGALSEIPSSVQAAQLLVWAVTKFNRKLDAVCAKLGRAGVSGLHGGARRPALNRRTRLVQTAVEQGVVTVEDLQWLEGGIDLRDR
jgi:hypothetical protein